MMTVPHQTWAFTTGKCFVRQIDEIIHKENVSRGNYDWEPIRMERLNPVTTVSDLGPPVSQYLRHYRSVLPFIVGQHLLPYNRIL